jgi:hypothetical protein
MKLWMLFVIMTVLCWGTYVPTLHHGQHAMGGKNAAFKAFLFVGLAYVLVTAIVLAYTLYAESGGLTVTRNGSMFSMIAGVLGAGGALGIVLALRHGGSPTSVAPLVFAGAPIMATFVAMAWDRPKSAPSGLFYVGILLAALGAGLVLRYKPSSKPPQTAAQVAPVSEGQR